MKRAKNIKDLECVISNGLVMSISDIHIPFQDESALKAVYKFIKKYTPDVLILNGDILDMYMLSRFTKGEGRNPLEEINQCREVLKKLRTLMGKKKPIYYVIGNHETRLERCVLSKVPELESLVEDVFTIIGVEKFDIKGCASLTINDIVSIKHGTLLGNKSGLSAIKEMEASYMSGTSGHTHRLCKYIARKAGRKFFWIESGCLCSLNPEYMINPNWQQGFATIRFKQGKVVDAKAIEIENGEVLDAIS